MRNHWEQNPSENMIIDNKVNCVMCGVELESNEICGIYNPCCKNCYYHEKFDSNERGEE